MAWKRYKVEEIIAYLREVELRLSQGQATTLIQKAGFDEASCPVSGEGTGGRNFSWTAAIWLARAGQTDTKGEQG